MRIINPIGRKVEPSASAHNIMQACMCGVWANFSGTRTTDDSCDHCGCNCKNSDGNNTRYRSNNFNDASNAGRATPVS
ncbi:Apre_1838 family putative sactipeptide bacteriocin [Clostridium sporogenes]|uniref:Apre_1838 family putative sactipeptide bacteriocin n=1 Tax=Clostridium sporogenes TaxID=1509 RepID=UPI0013D55702|nr:Apre_1838 family putative sactipeptide bacteriocin [Clostridium sporogenes]MBU5299505.1 Apre_1838 family putative sactipeptide bacteriocin [Clostridium sporogenes]NFP92018.1 putative bacteriocin precursor [Clostridium sporogenes]